MAYQQGPAYTNASQRVSIARRYWQNKDLEGQNEEFISSSSLSLRDKSPKKCFLGRGSFAEVYAGKFSESSRWPCEECAVKIFNDGTNIMIVQEEFKKIKGFQHPNIVSVFGVVQNFSFNKRRALALVMEICDKSLHDYIRQSFKSGVPREKTLQIIHDIVSAMVYLHDLNIVHGDLRCSNILVQESDNTITAKVSDFGMSHGLAAGGYHVTTTFADPKYLPPEVFMNNERSNRKNSVKLTRQVDVFCLGPIAIQLGCGEFPEPTGKSTIKKGIVVREFTEIERREKHIGKVKSTLRTFIDQIVQQCMDDKPERRASFLDLLHITEEFRKKGTNHPQKELLEEKRLEHEKMRACYEESQQSLRFAQVKIQILEEEKQKNQGNLLECEELKRVNGKLQEQVNDQGNIIKKASQEAMSMAQERKTLESTIEDLKAQHLAKSEECTTLKKDRGNLQSQVKVLEELIKDANQKAMSMAQSRDSNIEDLEGKLKQAEQQRDQFRSSCQGTLTRVTELQEELKAKDKQLEETVHRKDEMIRSMDEDVRNLQSENTSLEQRANDMKSQMEKKKAEFDAKITKMQKEATDADHKIQNLERKLKDRSEVTEAAKKFEHEKAELKRTFQAREQEFQYQSEQFEHERKRYEKKVKDLENDAQDLLNKCELLSNERDHLQTECKDCMTERDELLCERDRLSNERDKIASENNDYMTERNRLDTEKKDLENRLSKLRNKHEMEKQEAVKALDRLTKENIDIKQEMQKAQEFVAKCLKRYSNPKFDTKSSLQGLLVALDEAHSDAVTKLKKNLSSLKSLCDGEKEEASKMQQAAVKEKNELDQKLSAKETELEELSRNLQSLKAEKNAAEKEKAKLLQTYNRRITELKDKCSMLQDHLSGKKDNEQEQERLTSLHVQLQDAQRYKEEINENLSKERENSAKLNKEITLLQRGNKALEKQLTKERGRVHQELVASRVKVMQLQEQMKSLRICVADCMEQLQTDIQKKLEEQTIKAHGKLIASQTLITKNEHLVTTCRGYEKRNTVLHRKWITTRLHLDKMKGNCQDFRDQLSSKMEEFLMHFCKNKCDVIEAKLDCCEKRLCEAKTYSMAKDERIKELMEELQEYSEMETKLTDAADCAKSDNLRHLGIEEANRKTILVSTMVEVQKQHANRIFTLEEEHLKLSKTLTEATDKLHQYQRQLSEKTEECETRRLSEERLNNEIVTKKEVIVNLTGQLVGRKEEIEGFILEVEAEKVVHDVIMACLLKGCKEDSEKLEGQLSACKSECHRVTKTLTKREAELRQIRIELVQTKRKYDERKKAYCELEDAQMGLLIEVEDLKAHMQSCERKCNDDSHISLEAENEDIKERIAVFESRFEMVSSEKDDLQAGHDYLAKTLQEKTVVCQSLEEENEKLKKQDKQLKARHKLLKSREVELEIKRNKLEALNENLQKQKEDILHHFTKLLEESKEWGEMQKGQREAMNSDHQQMLLQQQSTFVQRMNAMAKQYDRQIKLVEAQSQDVPEFVNFSLQTMRDFMIPYLLYLQLPTWLTDDSNQGPVLPRGELSQLCEIDSSRIDARSILHGSLFPIGSSKYYSCIHSECPKTVNDIVKMIRENYEHDIYQVYSVTFLKSTDKVYLCHLLIGIVPKMIAPHSKKLEPDVLYSLVQVALVGQFGIEMQKTAKADSLSRGVVYNPEWYGRKAPQWSHGMVYEELPCKAVPVFEHLQREAAHGLKKEIVSLMTRIPF